jgi:hypothetical protein
MKSGLVLLLMVCGVAQAQEYSHGHAWNVWASYSNDSSHIYIGQEANRKIASLGAGYGWRLVQKKNFDFTWEVEVRPVNFIRDPYVKGVAMTVQTSGTPVPSELPYSGPFEGPTRSNCASGTTIFTGGVGASTTGAPPPVTYIQTITQTCSERWTYAGGFSPLGLRFNFAKRHRLQPFAVGNGGILVTPHDEPVNYSNRINFTFEFGAGLEWFEDARRSWTVDYRVHHFSNASSGYYNPGIDSQMVRVGYRFGR